MKYVLYQSESDSSFSFFLEGDDRSIGALAADARLIWSVEAASWEEACELKHEFLGWEPYKPMDE